MKAPNEPTSDLKDFYGDPYLEYYQTGPGVTLWELILYNHAREKNFIRWTQNVVSQLKLAGQKVESRLETTMNFGGEINTMWIVLPDVAPSYKIALTQCIYASWTKAGVDPGAQIQANARWMAQFPAEPEE